MELKEFIEKRNAKVEEMKKIFDKVKEEVRAFSEEEKKEYDKLEKEIRDLDSTIEALKKEYKITEPEKKDKSKTVEEEETRAFADFIRAQVEHRSDVNMTKGDNGAVIPKTIANKIITEVKNICPIAELATVYNVKGSLSIPCYDESAGAITMAYKDEFTELESTAGKLKSVDLTGFLAGVLTKVSKSLINNNDFDLVSFVVNQMALSYKAWLEKECLIGTTSKITGLSEISQKVVAGATNAITSDELIDLQETIPDVYQSDAVWIMHPETRAAIRKLKDGEGNYLLNPDYTGKWNYMLLGKPVFTSDNMPKMAADKDAIYYGDLSGLALKLTENMEIQVLLEKFATQHAIGIVGWAEVDAKIENQQKLAKLTMKAS